MDAGRLTTPEDGRVPTVEVGSVPGDDPDAAARDALRLHPWLPSVPEMPQRSPLEGVVARGLEAMAFVTDPVAGSLSVAADDPALVRAVEAARPSVPSLARAAGLHAMRRALAAGAPPARVKVALLGPVALARALRDVHGRRLAEVPRVVAALSAFAARLGAVLAAFLRETGTSPVLQVDEPGTTDRLSPAESALLGDCLASLRATGAPIAVHDCGAETGAGLAALAPDLALVDASRERVPFLDDPIAFRRLLDGGCLVAWGVVPTDGRPLPDPACGQALLRRAGLAVGDEALVRRSSAFSPACGLGSRGAREASRLRQALAGLSLPA